MFRRHFSPYLGSAVARFSIVFALLLAIYPTFLRATAPPYVYQRAIVIGHANVPNTDQTNFPLLVSLTDPLLATTVNGGRVTSASGYDIIFTSDAAGANKPDHEIESYNPATGQIAMWVRIPNLSHTVDTTIYLQYGNAGITTSQENKTGVWDGNYMGVWHLSETSGTTLYDSTANGENATKSSATDIVPATGAIGGGQQMNNWGPNAPFTTTEDLGTNVTLSGWLYAAYDDFYTSWGEIGLLSNSDATYDLMFDLNDLNWYYGWWGVGGYATGSQGAWHYYVATRSGTAVTFYVDGALQGTATLGSDNDTILSPSGSLASNWYSSAIFDELRASNVVRSADWIQTEYNNQSSPATFYSVSSEATVGVPSVPTGLTAAAGNGQVSLSWVASSGATSYNVYRGTSPSGENSTPIATGLTTTTYTDSGLSNGTTYYYTVAAVNSAATSAWSSEASATPTGTAPPYVYQRVIVTSHSNVPNTDQSNFPLLVSLTDPLLATTANGGRVTSASGYDIIFTSDQAGANKLDHEIESYNPATGQIAMWVRIPRLSHTGDTTIYLLYGNANITTSQENKTGVWDSNYQAVYHWNETSGTTIHDSTANGNHIASDGGDPTPDTTPTFPPLIDGHWCYGYDNPHSVNSSTPYDLGTNLTLSMWLNTVNPWGFHSLNGTVFNSSAAGANFQTYWEGGYSPTVNIYLNYGTWQNGVEVENVSATPWHYLTLVRSGTTVTYYLDGASVGTVTLSSNPDHAIASGDAANSFGYSYAAFDEQRASNIARSADWIRTEYANQSSPGTFYSVSGEAAVGVPSAPAGLTALAGNGQVSLSWTAASGATSYSVYRGTQPGQESSTALASGITTTSFTDTGLSNGTTYYYTVAAVNSVATSAQSNEASATPAVPTGLWISTPSLPNGALQAPYSAALSASGGVSPYSWAVTQGALPAGLSLTSSTGVISGTPSGSTGASTFTVQVTDATSATASQQFTIQVVTLTIRQTTIPNAQLNGYYTAGLQVAGGTAPYTWSWSGNYPSGLSLDPNGGYISGVPTAAGGYSFTVQVTDSNANTATQAYTMAVVGVNVTGVSPSVGVAGTQVTISGSGFGVTQGSGMAWLGTAQAAIVSWSDTQIVATVATGSQSGTAGVRQMGFSSSVPFTVNNATISSVTPQIGVPGTQVTITGSYFGATQGSGQVWLGTVPATVQSWSDTQIVAVVAAGALSGNAQVVQNGVMSNAVAFTVDTLQLASVSPNKGAIGTSVTFTGSGFGTSPGVAWLGNMAGQVTSWSDTQVVATVAAGAGSGMARIEQNGVWSNAVAFTVQAADGSSLTLSPSVINMLVGDTHAIQALNGAGQPVTGLTWASSDPTIVSLSTDDPPILTALAAGEVTITAGTASADVTVSDPTLLPGGALPVGTVLWSVPGDFGSVVPAVPSSSGVADVFAIASDYSSVQAIASDGTTAWTAPSGTGCCWPDFQGGLIYQNQDGSIMRLDGATGQAINLLGPATADFYTATGYTQRVVAPHPDGTVFVVQEPVDSIGFTVVGVDSATGAQKFSVPVQPPPVPEPLPDHWAEEPMFPVGGGIIAGDGYAYIPYWYTDPGSSIPNLTVDLHVLRVDSSGGTMDIPVYETTAVSWDGGATCCDYVSVITNADTGVVLTWQDWAGSHMAIVGSGGASVVNGLQDVVQPVLQMQDGSFVGQTNDYPDGSMVAFDLSGNERWSVPGYRALMATADGGVIATADGVSATIFDAGGNATGQMAQMPTQSWRGNVYQTGSVDRIVSALIHRARSLWASLGGGPSFNYCAGRPWYFELVWENNCAQSPWPCGFALYPDNPQSQPPLAVDASSQAGAIKSAALAAFQKAYDNYPVSVSEGAPNTGDNRVLVVDGTYIGSKGESCGISAPVAGGHESNVYYLTVMEQAQWALPLVMTTFQQVQNAVGRADLMKAIGTGIGNSAAHELAHQFLGDGFGMEDNSKNTYNSGGCRGDLDPWTFGFGPIQWENVTANALSSQFGGGWHR